MHTRPRVTSNICFSPRPCRAHVYCRRERRCIAAASQVTSSQIESIHVEMVQVEATIQVLEGAQAAARVRESEIQSMSFRPAGSKVSCFPGAPVVAEAVTVVVEVEEEEQERVVVAAVVADRVPMGCGLARFSRETSSGSTGMRVGRLGAGAQISFGNTDAGSCWRV